MSDNIVLSAQNLRARPEADPVDLNVHEGEIVGLAGLEGHGQEDFLELLCGLLNQGEGEVQARGRDGRMHSIVDLHSAIDAGMAYLPRNRKTEGILPALSVFDNFNIATLNQTSRFGLVRKKAQHQRLAYYRERLGIVFPSPSAPITSLSGGNQQKVLLARWMAAQPRIMLLNDPTRGVDLPTRMTLYEVFREVTSEDRVALVLLSTEVEELLQLCHRILVFRDGSVFTELTGDRISMSHVIAAMFGRHNGD